MTRIGGSDVALLALTALDQSGGGLRAGAIARILDVPYTSVERALEILQADRLVDRFSAHYAAAASPRWDAAVAFAVAFLELDEVVGAAARANPAVEFAGRDEGGVLIVTRRYADPPDEIRVGRFARRLHDILDIDVEITDKATMRDRLLVDGLPRERASGMLVSKGSVDRTFPDRTRRGDASAAPLGVLHPTLPAPSRRRLADLTRRYHLRRISAFGSSTRRDFRPDSDVDLLVEPVPGHRPRLGESVRLNSEVEDLFARDVDLLMGPITQPALANRIARDLVVLYDAAG